MDKETKKAKIDRFLKDELMSQAVFEVLSKAFMKPQKIADVNFLAASRIAIDLLQDAWKELEKNRLLEDKEPNQLKQVGL